MKSQISNISCREGKRFCWKKRNMKSQILKIAYKEGKYKASQNLLSYQWKFANYVVDLQHAYRQTYLELN